MYYICFAAGATHSNVWMRPKHLASLDGWHGNLRQWYFSLVIIPLDYFLRILHLQNHLFNCLAVYCRMPPICWELFNSAL